MSWLGSRGPQRRSRTLGPNVAGTWYPASPAALAQRVDALIDEGVEEDPASTAPPVVAVVAPHAGYDYSGRVAAHAFRPLRGRTLRRVVVVGPSHYVPFRGAVVPDADAYTTPLGAIPLELDALDALRDLPGFATNNAAFAREHSLEAELPFLQRALAAGFSLVPILIGGGSSGALAQQVADGVRTLVDAETLLVASSDFTHFGDAFGFRPFRERVQERIRELDLGAIRLVEEGDAAALEQYLARTGATVCGRDAISVTLRALAALPAQPRFELASYDTSGHMTGDWSHCVSYAALVLRSFP